MVICYIKGYDLFGLCCDLARQLQLHKQAIDPDLIGAQSLHTEGVVTVMMILSSRKWEIGTPLLSCTIYD